MQQKLISPNTIANQIMKDIESTGFKLDENHFLLLNLVKIINRVKYEKDSIIYNTGDEVNYVSIVAKGFLKVFQDFTDKRIFLKLVIPGDLIGLAAFLDNRLSQFKITAIVDSVLYHIPYDSFYNIYRNPKLMKWLTNYLINQINIAYKRCEILNSKNMYGRVADSILYFCDIIFKSDSFYLPITKKQLGHYANVTQENVSRILKSFVSEKIIKMKNRNIEISDKDQLVQISKLG